MPQAIPFVIGSVVSNAMAPKPPKPPAPPPTLTYAEARTQAQDALNPLYDEHLQHALRRVDQSNIARGFFGQVPGAALARSTAADIESRRAGQIAQLASQLQGMSHEQALQHQQMALAAQQQYFNHQMQSNPLTNIMRGMGVLDQFRNVFPQQWGQINSWLLGLGGNQIQPVTDPNFTLRASTGALSGGWWRPGGGIPVTGGGRASFNLQTGLNAGTIGGNSWLNAY